MSEQKPKYHIYFHNFLIWFALWAFALLCFAYCWRNIDYAWQDHYVGMDFAVIVGASLLLAALGIMLIKTRFDLAAYREKALKELPGCCYAGAVICILNGLVDKNYFEGDNFSRLLFAGVIVAVWGFVLNRYYKERACLFVN